MPAIARLMDWYKVAQTVYDGEDNGTPLGTLHIGRGFVLGVVLLLASLIGYYGLSLATGRTSWFGYRETSVTMAKGWIESGQNAGMVVDSLGVDLPMLALEGQEVVVHYDLRSTGSARTTAKVTVSCSFPCRTWETFDIVGPGSGELVVPVTDGDFYSFKVLHNANPARADAQGTFWLGVRSAK